MNRFDPARQASQALRALHDRIGYTTHFAVRSGDEAVYVDKLEGRRPYQMPSRVGMSLRLHSTAIGKAVLAELGAEEIRSIVARTGLPSAAPNTLTTVEDLLAHLVDVRARGYALDDEENLPGILCVAAPVFDHTGQVLGGISISGLAMDMSMEDLERFAPEVVAAAREVSLALGAPTPSSTANEDGFPASSATADAGKFPASSETVGAGQDVAPRWFDRVAGSLAGSAGLRQEPSDFTKRKDARSRLL
ncbi:IclR family transcriptional regulator [Streptosporangium lutulentum]